MPFDRQRLEARLLDLQAKDLLRRGYRVQALARKLLTGAGPGHPSRIDSGKLRSSVQVSLAVRRGEPVVRIGTDVSYARYVHEGTGLYGPHRTRVVPLHRKALAFRAASGKKVVVRSTRGMPGNPFLRDALVAARE